ncbi:MBL fold metallo-hydrolase [Planococcus sp. A6]|uniref:MBL fold metallo-hydrolase n=1 Tax=Planococcus sp. A6 TaxID=2992760 RepID=UPI00237C5145|nr:MBL fold metallo-hydrolase [Planococcus sp. A6]MDE0581655.1 MBL fold metallo-hydrolase [Planococcus sp. A6]
MGNFICRTCGVQTESLESAPDSCSVCTEERQYVSVKGQSWTTLEEMIHSTAYQNEITLEEQGLSSITTVPSFGIGQTAYLVQGENFNILWDCISYLDTATIETVKELGGIDAIALSHPHYYSTQVEWAETFDAVIYIHEDDKQWVTRPSDLIIFWSGETLEVAEGFTLHRIGGHFKGAAILEWKDGSAGKGVLLTGDIVRVVADRQWVSFMYSYPNFIPLPVRTVERMAVQLNEIRFDRVYDAFHRIVVNEAREAVQNSARRYIDALNGVLFDT